MSDQTPDLAAPLDQLLTQAANGPLRRFYPGRSTLVAFAGAAAKRPQRVAARLGDLTSELGRVALGTSALAPSARDRRFTDPAWTGNPLLRRLVQAHLAVATTAQGLVQDLPMQWRDAEKMMFATENLVQALAPSNNPVISPLAWKALIDTGGANVVRGLRNLISDMSRPPRVPSMVAPDAFTVGTDVAATPGDVVLRTPVLEVIQYRPQAGKVFEVPLLVVPPTINKYYVLDLAPGRSLVEYLVQQGQQVFMISWRNPDARHSKWGLDAYVTAILEAFDAVAEITGVDRANVIAACSGGLLACITAAHRAASGSSDWLASLSLLVTMIDQSQAGTTGAIMDERLAERAVSKSRRTGYLDGRSLAEVFAWLRPNDLIWNYWVNNYLQGNKPPKFDILFWNADTTRMPAKLHRDFVDVAMHNKLTRPGGISVLGTEIDLGTIGVDSYVVAGSADHICPWPNCYRSGQLLGGKTRFVLSTNGHIAALVNPPTNKKSHFQVSDDNSPDADEWRTGALAQDGSWWPDYARWLAARSGDEREVPATSGSARNPVIEAAPGSYVLDT